jgi:histidinol-phosphate/aromatic aminotransferase/cobyric acid decarboxylase-like protein
MTLNQIVAMRIEPRERLLRLFEDRIYNESFKDLSGWDRAAIGVPFPEVSLRFSPDDLRRYFFDRELPNECLEHVKGKIAHLASLRERTPVGPDNILLTPGATAALAVILHLLRDCAVEVVLTDPPFYFSIQKLCAALGMDFIVVNRSVEELDEHSLIFDLIARHRHQRKAIILAHPRYVVSRNYPSPIISEIRRVLNSDDFLIIDQSVDMEFCNHDNFMDLNSMSIKIRTLGKTLGLNGSRLAVIVADKHLIVQLNRHAGILYGSLDVAMLKLGAIIAQDPKLFEDHLSAIRKLVEETALESRLILGNSIFEVVRPENGFLGYILVDTSKIGRFALYHALLSQNVHAMFSAHVGLRQLYHREMIRINYLLNVREGLMVLRRFGERYELNSPSHWLRMERSYRSTL